MVRVLVGYHCWMSNILATVGVEYDGGGAGESYCDNQRSTSLKFLIGFI